MIVRAYVTTEIRPRPDGSAGLDVYRLAGSWEHAVNQYRERSGRPGRFDGEMEGVDGVVRVFDRDEQGGATYIGEHGLDVVEIIEE